MLPRILTQLHIATYQGVSEIISNRTQMQAGCFIKLVDSETRTRGFIFSVNRIPQSRESYLGNNLQHLILHRQ